MNKLDVALKLLGLINERKYINSQIVADELEVSLRTAQRYLIDLSALPCVLTDEKEHTYYLAPDHNFKDALLYAHQSERALRDFQKESRKEAKIAELICVMCGSGRRKVLELPLVPVSGVRSRDNRQKINHLLALVRRELNRGRCGFP